ncbi:hypothetical protein L202_06615 [Cryptococcus amylolentus CBS 6039]|uniref:Outer spore wall protein RRT8 n=2 Tax=Cryptococcus amylolentus TaxID=104669 RepID=A0A1E3HGL1_9TREE|nr:hypothetical protein L202_06615 [Cryptococcus amylolentus CBS 6039]ODN75482.1 hypothetical protein L202_06615 [Cryptococcus amylolentus CBS 6039]ODO03197.1 hypothetical protein I350_06042 [Cryptococcus amylolentus CBS 6273]
MSQPQTRKRTDRLAAPSRHSIQDSAKAQAAEVGAIIQDGITSASWIYPILGVLYLFSHPTLIKPLLPTILKGVALSAAAVVFLFTFTYLPQVGILVFVSGPLAFILAIPLVLSEAYFVVTFFARGFLSGQVGVDLFDAVLLQKGHQTLVENGRQVTDAGGGKAKQLGNLVRKPLAKFSFDNTVRYLITLPLNFIPVVGTVFFLGYNGYKAGPGYHARYFQLKNYSKEQRQAFVHKRRGAYLTFGTMAALLNLVPFVSILMTFTTVVGAALWADDLENNIKVTSNLRGETHKAKTKQAGEVEVVIPEENTEGAKKDL